MFTIVEPRSPQWPPWGQNKVAVAERVKQESMYGSAPLAPQKVDVVEI